MREDAELKKMLGHEILSPEAARQFLYSVPCGGEDKEAKQIYERRGRVDGQPLEDWLQAEPEILRQIFSQRG